MELLALIDWPAASASTGPGGPPSGVQPMGAANGGLVGGAAGGSTAPEQPAGRASATSARNLDKWGTWLIRRLGPTTAPPPPAPPAGRPRRPAAQSGGGPAHPANRAAGHT